MINSTGLYCNINFSAPLGELPGGVNSLMSGFQVSVLSGTAETIPLAVTGRTFSRGGPGELPKKLVSWSRNIDPKKGKTIEHKSSKPACTNPDTRDVGGIHQSEKFGRDLATLSHLGETVVDTRVIYGKNLDVVGLAEDEELSVFLTDVQQLQERFSKLVSDAGSDYNVTHSLLARDEFENSILGLLSTFKNRDLQPSEEEKEQVIQMLKLIRDHKSATLEYLPYRSESAASIREEFREISALLAELEKSFFERVTSAVTGVLFQFSS